MPTVSAVPTAPKKSHSADIAVCTRPHRHKGGLQVAEMVEEGREDAVGCRLFAPWEAFCAPLSQAGEP